MEMHIIQSKSGAMINIHVNVKNRLIEVVEMWNPNTCDCNY